MPTMTLLRRSFAIGGIVAALMASSGTGMRGAALAAQVTAADYKACQVQTEAEFRTAIEAITLTSMQSGLASLDYTALIADQWRKGGLDLIIDRQIDEAIAQIRGEESWTELVRSLGSKAKAEELAIAVAERVYRSEGFKTALEQAVVGLGVEIGKRIEIAAADATQPAVQCMRSFLGARYGSSVARAVGEDTAKQFEVSAQANTADAGATKILTNNPNAISGAAILIARRQVAKIAQRVGTRIVGSVLSRVVSVAAGGVGLVLIAKDIWDFRHGVLPIIASEMKSKASKDKVQSEIADGVKEQMGEHIKEIAAKTSEHVVEVWLEYRRAHAKVLELSEKHTAFKAFVETVKPDAMARLDQLTLITLKAENEDRLLKRVADGSFNEALNRWPAEAIAIARDQRSLEVAAKWMQLAERELPKVVEYEIHRKAGPETFSRASLVKLIGLDDRLAIQRLVAMKPDARAVLHELPASELKNLARNFDETQLTSLSHYLTGLSKDGGLRILTSVNRNPQKMQMLARSHVRNAVLGSTDQAAAVDVALRADGWLDLATLEPDVRLVLEGRISPILLWDKHPVAVLVAAFFGLILLNWMWRILTWRPGGRSGKRRAAAAAR
jgi:hypothetical protein